MQQCYASASSTRTSNARLNADDAIKLLCCCFGHIAVFLRTPSDRIFFSPCNYKLIAQILILSRVEAHISQMLRFVHSRPSKIIIEFSQSTEPHNNVIITSKIIDWEKRKKNSRLLQSCHLKMSGTFSATKFQTSNSTTKLMHFHASFFSFFFFAKSLMLRKQRNDRRLLERKKQKKSD